MKKIIAAALLLSSMATASYAVSTTGFSDMPNDWSTEALNSAVDNGLLNGENGLINAGGLLTRAQMATIVNRAFGATATASVSQFIDVSSDAWYYTELQKAIAMKTFAGSGNVINPNAPITRQEVFAVLDRAFVLPEGSASVLSAYKDADKIAAWAKDSAASMVSAGYIKGTDAALNPQAQITRAEFAQIMYNIAKTYVVKSPVAGTSYQGNVIVNKPDLKLSNVTVNGDLILADGIGDGDVTLDSVKVTGQLVVRGGGENSIKVIGSSDIKYAVVAKVTGGVRVATEGNAKIGTLTVAEGKDKVIVEGTVGTIAVETPIAVNIGKATVDAVTVTVEKAAITVSKDATVKTVTVAETAAKTALAVEGKVTTVSVAAAESTISGSGTVTNATVKADNVAIDTTGTKTTVEAGVTGTTSGSTSINSGTTTTTTGTSTSSGGSSGSSGGSSGGSSTPSIPLDNLKFVVKIGNTSVECPVSGSVSTLDLSAKTGTDVISEGQITTSLTGVQFDAGYAKFDLNTSYSMSQFLTGASANDKTVTVNTIKNMMNDFELYKDVWKAKTLKDWPATIVVNIATQTATINGHLIKSGYTSTNYTLILKW